MKKIALLGSTGSIGQNALEIVRHLGEGYEVVALAAKQNIALLEEQIRAFSPKLVAVYDEKQASELQRRCPSTSIVAGMEGVCEVATHPEANLVVSAMAGTLGLVPTVEAVKGGKQVALANKEALVSGGELLMNLTRQQGKPLIPIDSEHSALFQCLQGEKRQAVNRLILTASGGPFRTYSEKELQTITPKQALKHPNWSMGAKVTIDSSTLMNKGLELIEARWLFDLPVEQIDVVVHPQSIIHSMVEFVDRSILAQMGVPDMRVPIQYALTYPKREEGILEPFDFFHHNTLQFFPPDRKRFSCLALAEEALKVGKSLPCLMNAANEVLVQRFLQGEIGWMDIGRKLETVMEQHAVQEVSSIEAVVAIDQQARNSALRI